MIKKRKKIYIKKAPEAAIHVYHHVYDVYCSSDQDNKRAVLRLLRILFVPYYHEGSNLRGGEHLLNFGPR